MTTCQICGREIKSTTGKIAHHGYKRPGVGWQTASCRGARHLPYEQSCDLIPVVIKEIEAFIERAERALHLHISFPPESLKFPRGSRGLELHTVERPANFDSLKAIYAPRMYSYEMVFERRQDEMKQAIRLAKEDLVYLTKRLAQWVAPNEAVGRVIQ